MDRQKRIAEALLDILVPNNIRISPDGSKVVYSASTTSRVEDRAVSSLWLADVGKQHSASQLTSGLFNDESPEWSPGSLDEGCIAFTSDRGKPGESSAIYLVSPVRGEPYPMTRAENKKPISAFKWSPNQQFIAFISSDEKSEEQEAREKATGDVKVYGELREYNRLRCVHVATREVVTLLTGDFHVTDFAWNDDSTEIACITQETPDINSAGYHGTTFRRVSVAQGKDVIIGKDKFPGPARHLAYCSGNLWFLAGFKPSTNCTSSALYRMSTDDGAWSRFAFGETECARELRQSASKITLLVQNGLHDELYVCDPRTDRAQASRILTNLGEIHTWDVNFAQDEVIQAYSKSDSSSPAEVHSQLGSNPPCHLSQHGLAIAKHAVGSAQTMCYKAKDGTVCDGVFISPAPSSEGRKPLPTLVYVHGGPYYRTTVAFNIDWYYWVPYLVSAGYAVLCPNYRGGSSHGEEYASQARGRMGTGEFDDIISLVKHGISEGIIDESKVGIGGWSQGGFLSYLAVTRQDFHFKAAICGAGVSDWDMMSMSSDAPFFEAELAGKAPWYTDASDTSARHGSPIWNMKNVKTPIMILHGEKDERVPISQAVAFHRGCLHYGVPCEFVTYPREPHLFKERKHVLDMMKRVRRFCDSHLR